MHTCSRPYGAANRSPIPIALLFLGLAFCRTYAGADLTINRTKLTRSLLIETRTFTSDDCAFVEGCMPYTGKRKLLRFSIGFINAGNRDFIIGDPLARPDLFIYSPCHGHFHLKGFAKYALYNSAGTAVSIGRKQTFCVMDGVKYLSAAGPSHGYSCNDQGLTAGWQDIYYRNLDCQWLDITGLPRGQYNLKVTVNPGRTFSESNYANNSVTIPVTIP